MAPEVTTRIPESGRSGWTPETQIDYLLAVINEKHAQAMAMINEKHENATAVMTGNDRRYEERFSATQHSIELALAGQKEAVRDAFAAQKEAISAALASAERAVNKAEVAAEKRFEGVNEFRAQLGDQQRNLMPRVESEVIAKAMTDKVSAVEIQLSNKVAALEKIVDGLSSQLVVLHAERQGIKGGWGYAVGVVGFVLAIASIAIIVSRVIANAP